MCFPHKRLHLFQCSLFLFMFYSFILDVAGSNNNSEEIKSIFHSDDSFNHVPVLKGILRNENFAEGGLINNPMTTPIKIKDVASIAKEKNFSHNNSSNGIFSVKVSTEPKNVTVEAKEKKQIHLPTHFKLNETGDNLFLGLPEVIHVNGTSSVKPRKGVEFTKIVPRKGVENDNKKNHSFNNSCFWVNPEVCYSAVDFGDVNCNCCNNSDYLGGIIQQQPVINCSACSPLQSEPLGTCIKICCKNKIQGKESYSVTTTEDPLDFSYKNLVSKNQIEKSEFDTSNFTENLKKYRSKPTITKVPYDVEVDTVLIGKTSKYIFVPVVVSIFLLPLLGIAVYFIWKRTKDYWDTRYYKRMDFLIDGMYND